MTDSFISGAMALAVDADGNFTILHEPQGNRFRFSTATHEAKIGSFGTYVMTVTTAFTLGDPAITFDDDKQPDDVEIADLGTNSFTLKIFVSRESGDFPQKIGFQIHSSDPDVNSIVDPTILVEPPGGFEDELAASEKGTLVVGVAIDANEQFTYEELVVDSPYLEWHADIRSARISGHGTYYLVYATEFELGTPAIEFPSGQPSYITLSQRRYLAILEVAVRMGQPKETVPLKLKAASGGSGVNTEPTILVEPPGGQSDE